MKIHAKVNIIQKYRHRKSNSLQRFSKLSSMLFIKTHPFLQLFLTIQGTTKNNIKNDDRLPSYSRFQLKIHPPPHHSPNKHHFQYHHLKITVRQGAFQRHCHIRLKTILS